MWKRKRRAAGGTAATPPPRLFTMKLGGYDLVMTGIGVGLSESHLRILGYAESEGARPPCTSPQLSELDRAGLMDPSGITGHGRQALEMSRAATNSPPPYAVARGRDSELGFPTCEGWHLSTCHRAVLEAAVNDGGRYQPELEGADDLVAMADLVRVGLLDPQYRITAYGHFHLADRGWL